MQDTTVFESMEVYSTLNCTIKGFVECDSPSGKFPTDGFSHMVIRSDYQNYIQKYFSNTIFNYTSAYENPNVTAGYIDYILNTPNISEQYATVLLGTLPHQRYDYYSDSNFNKIKRNVLNELNKMNEALGFFNIASKPTVIRDLVVYDFALLFIGLIFDLVAENISKELL